MTDNIDPRIATLPCWQGEIQIEPLSGGMTNLNYRVSDANGVFVVRLGADDPVHLISRDNEAAACQAAFEAGLSPEPVYREDGVLVVRFIDGKVFEEADVREARNLERIIALLHRFHHQMPQRFQGIAVMFWVFQVFRHYLGLLERGASSHGPRLAELAAIAAELESAVGPVEIVFGHNDLLAANFIDDGERIWLIDFDYAGFNSPLFDLANLASNNELGESQELEMLERYFERPAAEPLVKSYRAMKCASLLRETLWSMVSELYSRVDMDFADYTQKNLARFESAHAEYRREYS